MVVHVGFKRWKVFSNIRFQEGRPFQRSRPLDPDRRYGFAACSAVFPAYLPSDLSYDWRAVRRHRFSKILELIVRLARLVGKGAQEFGRK